MEGTALLGLLFYEPLLLVKQWRCHVQQGPFEGGNLSVFTSPRSQSSSPFYFRHRYFHHEKASWQCTLISKSLWLLPPIVSD